MQTVSKKAWKRLRRKAKKSACIIYGVCDFSGNVRYIGQTRQQPKERLKWFYKNINHKRSRKISLSPIEKWIDEQTFYGLDVTILVLDANATWDVSEILYIDKYRREGCELLNLTRGGNDNMSNLERERLYG